MFLIKITKYYYIIINILYNLSNFIINIKMPPPCCHRPKTNAPPFIASTYSQCAHFKIFFHYARCVFN